MSELVDAITELSSASALIHDAQQPELRTLLVSDLVGSTVALHTLGDELGREYIARHDDLVRRCLRSHSGTEIAHTGDGFIASFANASRALHCACAMQEAAWRHNETSPHLPIEMRIGVHAGRPTEQDGRLVGACVHAAARVCATASGGCILASQPVIGLINPQWFRLVARGPSTLRGVPEPVALYELDWESQLRSASN
ncbi:MAG TPA: adenylate/guanylate cyclase domain-containing protein [Polyangiales bacterium]|nr:adenylate/guanylate cyclase domain-containing protein [Polyangiales bacterium]